MGPPERDTEPVLIDVARLEAWMDAQGLERGPLTGLVPLTGGTQNVLVRFRRGAGTFVLRRPPPHKRKNSDETMRREARLLAALAGTDVPHPALIASCPDTDVMGAAFYLMADVEGFTPGLEVPGWFADDPDAQYAVGRSMAAAIARLGRLDHEALGLGGLGRAEGWIERQTGRWRDQLASYSEFDGYDAPDLPAVQVVSAWLERTRPREWRPGLIHGDYHLANVVARPDGTGLAAVVDWELATVGDPLLDLGHMLATWPGSNRHAESSVDLPGLPTRAELIEEYGSYTDRDLARVDWYEVLACFRLAIILEGSNARAAAGLAPRAIGDRLHRAATALLLHASERIG